MGMLGLASKSMMYLSEKAQSNMEVHTRKDPTVFHSISKSFLDYVKVEQKI